MPSYANLMTETDADRREYSYLSSEESYSIIRDLENRNLVVPVVGDFGGPKAIRGIGRYLKEHGAAATIFYLSNVESYLFRSAPPGNSNGGFEKFYNNVRTLPLTASSTFVRSIPVVNPQGGVTGWQSLVTASIQQTIKDLDENRLNSYGDLYGSRRGGTPRGTVPGR